MAPNLPDENIHTERIERKKQELQEDYGLNLQQYHSDLPPEMESEWLDSMLEFERQFENADRVKLREFLGWPDFKPAACIQPHEFQAELDRVCEFMSQRGVQVDFIYAIEPGRAYRFILEELLDEEMDDIRLPGLVWHFIYEEFHPNECEDLKAFGCQFLCNLFARELVVLRAACGREGLYDLDGKQASRIDFELNLLKFVDEFPAVEPVELHPLQAWVLDQDAVVCIEARWQSLAPFSGARTAQHRLVLLRFKRVEMGEWKVVQVTFSRPKDLPDLPEICCEELRKQAASQW